MRYPGGKNAAGTWQWLINQMPPHSLYCEPFAGSAAVARLKRPAARTVLLDLDPGAIAALGDAVPAGTDLIEGDGLQWLYLYGWQAEADWFIYCDPPYMASAVRTKLRYKHVLSDHDHERLLYILTEMHCYVAISGYPSDLYSRWLGQSGKKWRLETRQVITRGNVWATECLWLNYPLPSKLHDVSFLGGNFRERERYRRQQKRWAKRLAAMSPLQRQALMTALDEVNRGPCALAENGGLGRAVSKPVAI